MQERSREQLTEEMRVAALLGGGKTGIEVKIKIVLLEAKEDQEATVLE